MKTDIILNCAILLCSMFTMLHAQLDSTFIQYFPLTGVNWQYFDEMTEAANVFIAHNGELCLQTKGTYHTPPPELAIPQSPIIRCNRNGQIINTSFGPVDSDGTLIYANYQAIMKDSNGGYLAFSRNYPSILRLNSDFHFLNNVFLYSEDNQFVNVKDFLIINDGFLVAGWTENTTPYHTVLCKFDLNLNLIWEYEYTSQVWPYIISTSDGGYLLWWHSSSTNAIKFSTDGDSLWFRQSNIRTDIIVESQNKYYGIDKSNISIGHAVCRIYSYGMNFANQDSIPPIITMYADVHNAPWEYGMAFKRMSDGNIILAVHTNEGELFKYDSDLNLIWCSNYMTEESIGTGNHPLIELPNGDLLYCARIWSQSGLTVHLALVRIDSDGNITPIEDNYNDVPIPISLKVYPNPFNQQVNIELKTDLKSDSKIAVYNIKGQLVKKLDLTSRSSFQMVAWNGLDETGKQCPDGIYLIKMGEGNQAKAIKVILLK